MTLVGLERKNQTVSPGFIYLRAQLTHPPHGAVAIFYGEIEGVVSQSRNRQIDGYVPSNLARVHYQFTTRTDSRNQSLHHYLTRTWVRDLLLTDLYVLRSKKKESPADHTPSQEG
jgi:hypothetical protein